MEDHQPLPVRGVRVEILLPCEEEVRVPSDGSAVGDEVSDGLHDVPAVVPPGEPGQDAELCGHEAQAGPGDQTGSLPGMTDDLLSLTLQRLQLGLQLLQLPDELLLP